jgi:eukaryotic-like serine/threonine-protein kinase
MRRVDVVQVLAGRYRLVERLGTGGMSVVWRAYDEVLGRQVAVKVLAAKLTADQGSRDMIRAEAQAAARLSHPHVTGVYDYGESTTDDGQTVPYVVMELISGRTLAERLARGPLPWRAALRVGAETAAALAAAHARGLVHRDVKPANVMLTAAGVKVVDFGIAAVVGDNVEPGPDGVVFGTPAYLAPERLAGGPVRPATDVYALGLLLYRALTGNLPWEAETTTQMITAHVYAEPSPLPAVDGLPDGVADLCLRCLAKDPADRPTAREVARTLAGAAGVRVPLPAEPGENSEHDLVLDPLPIGSHPGAGRTPGRLRQAVAALFGPVVDPSADTSILPSSVIDSAAIRNRRRRRRRRVVQFSGVAVGLVGMGLVLSMCTDLPQGRKDGSAAAAVDGPAEAMRRAACTVRYLTRNDTAGQFQVDVTVTNNTADQVADWALQFHFDGDQTLRDGTTGQWSQSPTGTITVRDPSTGGSLAAKASTTVGFRAEYHTSNPMPTEFALNGAACTYVLVGASGETQTGGPGITDGSGGEAAGGQQGGPAGGNHGPITVGGTTGDGTTGGGVPAPAPTPTTGAPDPVPTNKRGLPKPSKSRTKSRSPKPPAPPPSPSDSPLCVSTVCLQSTV